MKMRTTIVLSGFLLAAVTAGVAGVAADRAGQDRTARRDRLHEEQPDRPRSRGVLRAPDGQGLRALEIDRPGSRIGVTVNDVAATDGPGAAVDTVDAEGPAQKAGVKPGDVVVEFDGERVRSARQLTRLVQETPAGRTVKLTVRRGSERQTMDVTPESRDTFVWNGRDVDDIRREVERGLERGLRDWPRPDERWFEFRRDGVPSGAGRSGRGRLGVEVNTLTEQLADHFGAKGGGVLVSSVATDSPAERAGMKAGDVITAVNGTAVRDASELVEELGRASSTAAVSVGIVRDRQSTTLTVTIESPRSGQRSRRARPA